MPMQAGNLTRVRIDKWLWAARFFKTRALASEAVNGGHVHVNGERCKRAHALKAGDVLKITKSGATYVITILVLSERRGSARVAQALYAEDSESLANRQLQAAQYRLHVMANPHPVKRPDKRERRQLKAWREQS